MCEDDNGLGRVDARTPRSPPPTLLRALSFYRRRRRGRHRRRRSQRGSLTMKRSRTPRAVYLVFPPSRACRSPDAPSTRALRRVVVRAWRRRVGCVSFPSFSLSVLLLSLLYVLFTLASRVLRIHGKSACPCSPIRLPTHVYLCLVHLTGVLVRYGQAPWCSRCRGHVAERSFAGVRSAAYADIWEGRNRLTM